MLCGTPLAYEDDVWNTSARFIKEMQEVLGLPRFDENNARYMDLIPEVRDYLLEKITDIEGIEIVHVSEEY